MPMPIRFLVCPIFFLLFLSCGEVVEVEKPASVVYSEAVNEVDGVYDLIPFPQSLEKFDGHFHINKNTALVIKTDEPEVRRVVHYFWEKIKLASGLSLSETNSAPRNGIFFELDENITAEEGYELFVDRDNIFVKAKKPIGLFYAVQTIRQLMPPEFEGDRDNGTIHLDIPDVKIQDAPRFPYRGMHLDVARHFFDVATVKRFIDQLAYHKMNYFHWHLTEDQGWRIEIKKYPKLTEVAAYRDQTLVGHYNDQPHQFDSIRYGGFYTQEEIKAVVQYAADNFITVIPEIEMPGHAQAAIAAYPALGCADKPLDVMQIWGISENVYCPTEETFTFLQDVIDEIIPLFPGKYIHIGGDECPKTQWEKSKFCKQLMRKEGLKDAHELQSYFIQRMERYINAKGKQIIGWDEILEGGLAPNATVMSWRGMEGGIAAAQAGHDVIMTPTAHCYLDYYQSDHPEEPLAIGGFLPLEKVYALEPVPAELSAEEAKHVLGAQVNLWTEYIPSAKHLEYMAFPRLSALAEVVWSPKANRDFEDFSRRVVSHLKRLENMDINAANHMYDLKASFAPQRNQVEINLELLAKDVVVHYALDGREPIVNSKKYNGSFLINESADLNAQAFKNGEKIGRPVLKKIQFSKSTGRSIALTEPPHKKYAGSGPGSLINGVLGSDERYGDAEWLGFDAKDFEAILDFGKEEELSSVNFRFFNGPGQWIYLPKSISIWSSSDGTNFEEVAQVKKIAGEEKVVEQRVELEKVKAQYLKILAEHVDKIPAGAQGAGNGAWLFVDEIRVE